MSVTDDLRGMLAILTALVPDLPEPQTNYRFDSVRRWKFDLAWPECMVAVELDGGQWAPHGGRHNRDADREKINSAVVAGWKVLRFSTQQIENEPCVCVTQIEMLLQAAQAASEGSARIRAEATQTEILIRATRAANLPQGNEDAK